MKIPTDAELIQYTAWAKEDRIRGNLGQQAAARRMLELLGEVEVARRLVRGLYHQLADVKGQGELQAELERYAGELGVIKAAV